MSALRTGEDRVARSLTIRRQTDPHQLISLQSLLAAQTANGLLIRIVGDTIGCLNGWFHASSLSNGPRGISPNSGRARLGEFPSLAWKVESDAESAAGTAG